MMILTTIVALVLTLLALLHVFWAFGIWLPIRDEEQLARTVVGAKGVTRMPGPIPSGMVAVGLGFLALELWMPHNMMFHIVMWAAVAVFLFRGLLAYAPVWRRMTPEEPFATLDRTRYGPLCLALGVAIAIIILRGA